MDNERLQEIFLMIGDKVAPVNKKWWYALGITIIALIPGYYLMKYAFVQSFNSGYRPPQVISPAARKPLEILDKKILQLSPNVYAGYFKIKNIEYESGVGSQSYSAQFRTFGGTVLNSINGATYVLPQSEKLVVLPRFTADQKPDELIVELGESKFSLKPKIDFEFALERESLQNNPGGLVITAGVKNLTAFKIKKVDLPVVVYNNANQIVAVSTTNINDLEPAETRTFQYTWPQAVPGALRAEISPEINIFDRGIFSTQDGVSPF